MRGVRVRAPPVPFVIRQLGACDDAPPATEGSKMVERWRPGTVEGNDGAQVRVWRKGDWLIAQDVNVGALAGKKDRWGFTLQRVMPNGDEVPVDVPTTYGTACWGTRAEAGRVADGDPPLLDAATVRARHREAWYAALNRHVRRLTAALRAEPRATRVAAYAGTDAADEPDIVEDLDALAVYLGARRMPSVVGIGPIAAALLFICESAVDVEDQGGRIALTFDAGREWSVEVSLAWPFTERRWRRVVERADEKATEARERHEERS